MVLIASLTLLVLAWQWTKPLPYSRPLYGAFDQNTRFGSTSFQILLQLEEKNAYQEIAGISKGWCGPIIRTDSSITILHYETLKPRYRIDWDGKQHLMTQYTASASGTPPVPYRSWVITPIDHTWKLKALKSRGWISIRSMLIWNEARKAFKAIWP